MGAGGGVGTEIPLCHLLPGSQRAPGTSVFFLSFAFPSLEAGGVWGLKGMAKIWRRASFGCFLWQARELPKNTSTDGKANIQAGQMLPKFAPNKEVGKNRHAHFLPAAVP